jgi:hypothetical protein
MCIGREGEIAAADPSSREQHQQYAFNKNKYSSRWLECTIWLYAFRGMKPAIITIVIIIINVSIFIFQTKSWHQVLKAKNAIQKLGKVVDSSSPLLIIIILLLGELLFLLLWVLFYNSLLILIPIIGASSLFLYGFAAMDLPTDGVILSIHRTDL